MVNLKSLSSKKILYLYWVLVWYGTILVIYDSRMKHSLIHPKIYCQPSKRLTEFFHILDEIGNNANIGSRGFTT